MSFLLDEAVNSSTKRGKHVQRMLVIIIESEVDGKRCTDL